MNSHERAPQSSHDAEIIHPAIGPYEKAKLTELLNPERKARLMGAHALFATEIRQGVDAFSSDELTEIAEQEDDEFEYAEKASAMLVVRENPNDPESPVVAAADVRMEYTAGYNRAYLKDIAVDPNHRGEGYGSALLVQSEEYARMHNADVMQLFATAKTSTEQEDLIEWYESHGYVRTGIVQNDSEIGMSKKL